jgi:hypothetical protein
MTSTAVQLRAHLPTSTTRLLVTVRDPQTRAYRPVGFLSQVEDDYRFSYLRRELERDAFRPLPGLARAVEGPVSSSKLFPLFSERVISARRPDRHVSLDALGLPLDAAPMEVLARSHGQRVGDTIELLPAPEAGPGEAVAFTFLTHGVRYLDAAEQGRLASLTPGERLRLRPEPTNEVNPRALLVTDSEDVRLGWLPDPLIQVLDDIVDERLSVERANGPEVGFHFRLLVRLQGRVQRERGLLAGPEWETI